MTGETETENIKPFGDRLAEARKSLGLTLEELSKTLNLDIKLLESLEHSDVEQLPPPTYVQGYIKAYTKALGISSEDIHADFLKSVSESQDVELQPRSPLPIETTSETPLIKSVSIIFVILAISALAFMIYSYYSGKVDTVDYVLIEKKFNSDSQNEKRDYQSIYEQDDELTASERDVSADDISEGLNESDDALGDVNENKIDVPEIEMESSLNSSQSDVTAVDDSSAAMLVVDNEDSLMIRATTESWAEIRDDNKVRIYYGMLVPEDLRILKGKAPFDVFLGNALHVNIAVNDIDVDMSDYIRANNVAHFKVSEKSNQIVFH